MLPECAQVTVLAGGCNSGQDRHHACPGNLESSEGGLQSRGRVRGGRVKKVGEGEGWKDMLRVVQSKFPALGGEEFVQCFHPTCH